MKYPKISWSEIQKYRLASLGIAATILALVVVHVFWLAPVLSEKEILENRLKQQQDLMQKYEDKLKQAHSIRENLVKKEAELREMQKRLFRGNDPYQLAASLGETFSPKGGGKAKLEIKTYQVIASKEYGLYQEVHLRFNLMTTVEGLHFFLDRVGKFQTAILVKEINIQKIQKKGGPDLVVNVILAALMEKGEKS
ncbi:MAG TPA: type 4a pilus biogenesis protein PilO [Syntrophobacteraceae bacterium]|nr:type 4a pilus biogenesis protein PilO [Syntrophobacteraceae bacterium]